MVSQRQDDDALIDLDAFDAIAAKNGMGPAWASEESLATAPPVQKLFPPYNNRPSQAPFAPPPFHGEINERTQWWYNQTIG